MAKRIRILAIAGILISLYFIFIKDRDDMVYLFALALVVGMIGYTFQFQIDNLMTRGVPMKIDLAMRQMLLATSPWFANLPPDQQKLVEDRMHRWVVQKEFINQNEQDAPEDVKYILAFYAILLTIHQKSFLYDGIDRIVFYHHPFLSPGQQDDVHISEIEIEDGTMIISVPHLIKGHMEKGYYNIALHTIADAFRKLYLPKDIIWKDTIWDELEAISHIPKERIEAYIGLPGDDPWPVAVHHQYVYAGSEIEEVTQRLPQLKYRKSLAH